MHTPEIPLEVFSSLKRSFSVHAKIGQRVPVAPINSRFNAGLWEVEENWQIHFRYNQTTILMLDSWYCQETLTQYRPGRLNKMVAENYISALRSQVGRIFSAAILTPTTPLRFVLLHLNFEGLTRQQYEGWICFSLRLHFFFTIFWEVYRKTYFPWGWIVMHKKSVKVIS